MADTNSDHKIHDPTSSAPRQNSDSDDDSPIPSLPNEFVEPETMREPKRRKNCPSALEKFEVIDRSLPNSSAFSFSFNTEFPVGTPELTPKFGSFNLALSSSVPNLTASEINKCFQIPAKEDGCDGEEGIIGAEVREGSKDAMSVLVSGDEGSS